MIIQISSEAVHRAYQLSASQLQSKYARESERLLTFEEDFRSRITTGTALARAGFINFKAGTDEVLCVWCNAHIRNFENAIDAVALHFALSAHICEFVRYYDRKNIPITDRVFASRQKGFLSLAYKLPGNVREIKCLKELFWLLPQIVLC